MKNLLLLMLLFLKFASIANASVGVEMESESTTLKSAQPLMIMYNKSWHDRDQACNNPFSYSLAIQFADLRLTDDIYGINGLVGRIGHQRRYWDPFLYKVSNGDKSFHLLGTLHDLPFCTLPSFVKDIIFGCETLICERYARSKEDAENQTITFRDRYCSLSHTWLDQLSSIEQNVFNKVCYEFHSVDCELVNNRNVDIRVVPAIYEQAHYSFGMDFQAKNYFKENGRSIHGLDNTEEDLDFDETLSSKDAEKAFNTLRSMIAATLRCKGLMLCRGTTDYNQYLSGAIAELKQSLVNPENARYMEDQKRWWPRLNALINNSGIKDPCVAVGIAHCIWEGGLLDFFFQDGWTVEKYNVNYRNPKEFGPYLTQLIQHSDIL